MTIHASTIGQAAQSVYSEFRSLVQTATSGGHTVSLSTTPSSAKQVFDPSPSRQEGKVLSWMKAQFAVLTAPLKELFTSATSANATVSTSASPAKAMPSTLAPSAIIVLEVAVDIFKSIYESDRFPQFLAGLGACETKDQAVVLLTATPEGSGSGGICRRISTFMGTFTKLGTLLDQGMDPKQKECGNLFAKCAEFLSEMRVMPSIGPESPTVRSLGDKSGHASVDGKKWNNQELAESYRKTQQIAEGLSHAATLLLNGKDDESLSMLRELSAQLQAPPPAAETSKKPSVPPRRVPVMQEVLKALVERELPADSHAAAVKTEQQPSWKANVDKWDPKQLLQDAQRTENPIAMVRELAAFDRRLVEDTVRAFVSANDPMANKVLNFLSKSGVLDQLSIHNREPANRAGVAMQHLKNSQHNIATTKQKIAEANQTVERLPPSLRNNAGPTGKPKEF